MQRVGAPLEAVKTADRQRADAAVVLGDKPPLEDVARLFDGQILLEAVDLILSVELPLIDKGLHLLSLAAAAAALAAALAAGQRDHCHRLAAATDEAGQRVYVLAAQGSDAEARDELEGRGEGVRRRPLPLLSSLEARLHVHVLRIALIPTLEEELLVGLVPHPLRRGTVREPGSLSVDQGREGKDKARS